MQFNIRGQQFFDILLTRSGNGCTVYFIPVAVADRRELHLHSVLCLKRQQKVGGLRRFSGRYAETLHCSGCRFNAPGGHRCDLVVVIMRKGLLHLFCVSWVHEPVTDQRPFKFRLIDSFFKRGNLTAINTVIFNLRVVGNIPVNIDIAALRVFFGPVIINGRLTYNLQIFKCGKQRFQFRFFRCFRFKAYEKYRKASRCGIHAAHKQLVLRQSRFVHPLPLTHPEKLVPRHFLHFFKGLCIEQRPVNNIAS